MSRGAVSTSLPEVICSPCSTVAVNRYSWRAKVPAADSDHSSAKAQSPSYSSPRWRVRPPLTLKPAESRRITSRLSMWNSARSSDAAARAPAQAELGRVRRLGIEVRDRLLALQAVELGRFRSAEAAREGQVGRHRVRQVPHQPDARRDVGEIVRAIGRPCVQAAAGAGYAVLVRIAVDHPVVVVVARVLEAKSGLQRPARCKRAAPVGIAAMTIESTS